MNNHHGIIDEILLTLTLNTNQSIMVL